MSPRQHALPGVTPSGSHAGRTRQAVGAQAERVVERAHQACVVAGLASPLLRLDAGIRFGPGGKAVVRAKGSIDYVASAKGRPVYLEVKAWEGPRWELRKIEPHQLDALWSGQVHGAIALVMVVAGGALYTVPYRVVAEAVFAWRREGGPASLGLDEMAPWLVPIGALYLRRFLEER